MAATQVILTRLESMAAFSGNTRMLEALICSAGPYGNGSTRTNMIGGLMEKAPSKYKGVLYQFLEYRRQLLERRKEGKRGFAYDGKVGRRKRVSKKRTYREYILPVADDFYTPEQYKAKFGTLKLPKGKGHVKRTVNGIRGIIVPSGDAPMKLQRTFGSCVEQEEVLYSGNSEDGVESEEAFGIFEDVMDQKQQDYSEAAVGLSMDELMKLVAAESQVDGNGSGQDAAKGSAPSGPTKEELQLELAKKQ